MNVLGVIAARGGSRGVPGKNIRPMAGKPLIAWSIEQALATPEIDRLIVSTDDEAIRAAAREAGAATPFTRPAELARAETGKFVVWQHALAECEAHYDCRFDLFVDLDCTCPLRDPDDISNAIRRFGEARGNGADGVISICRARRSPYFNMVERGDGGTLLLCKNPAEPIVRRQDAPAVFDIVASIYVLDADYVRNAGGLFDGRLEGYEMDETKSLDIDSELDFRIVEMLMNDRLDAAS